MVFFFPLAAAQLDGLTLFGLVAVSLMLLFYALEGRSNRYTLGFAVACVLGSAYGFLQGAWPFGIVEGIWSMVALRKWRRGRRPLRGPIGRKSFEAQALEESDRSNGDALFGPAGPE